jgi:gamma-glutamyltranspeptidase/glutathione hydrolase
MMKFKHIVLLSSTTLGLMWGCKTPAVQVNNTPSPISKAKENQGFYQFLNDDPNASPFVAKKEPVYAQNGMCRLLTEASKVGVEIMKKGGNAIDATIATQFA